MQNWIVVSLLLALGCGDVGGAGELSPPDATVEVIDGSSTIDGAPVDGTPAVVDRSCVEVKARLGTATDGVYSIDPDRDGVSYKPFEVFCGGMATATPREYLELKRTSQPADAPSANFSTYATGAVHGAWTCDCGVVTTLFSKIRIDPVTLVADVDDRTFTVFATSTQLACLQTKPNCPGATPYAVASACVFNFDASGRANVDLRDMGFHVAGNDVSMFVGGGFEPAGTVSIDPARRVVDLTGGGDCGFLGAASGLQLAQDF